MKPGTIVRLPDGREGTTVYHNLDGYGIKWGRHVVDEDDLPAPDAMLRDPYPSATIGCVGKEYAVVKEPRPRELHQPMTLSAGEVAQLADLFRGLPDEELDEWRASIVACMSVFVPASDREQARENFKRLGLL